MKVRIAAVMLSSLLALTACGGDTDGDTDAGTGHTSIEVTGNWSGSLSEEKNLRVSIFDCPFSMPPSYFFEGTANPSTGDVYAKLDDLSSGDWCLMAYIDMDSTDGLSPAAGLDPINDTGDENASGAIPISVIAGKTNTLVLKFAIH